MFGWLACDRYAYACDNSLTIYCLLRNYFITCNAGVVLN